MLGLRAKAVTAAVSRKDMRGVDFIEENGGGYLADKMQR